MRRTTVTLLVLLVLKSEFADERGPVCREASVVDEIAREVRASNYYGNVDSRLVTESRDFEIKILAGGFVVRALQ